MQLNCSLACSDAYFGVIWRIGILTTSFGLFIGVDGVDFVAVQYVVMIEVKRGVGIDLLMLNRHIRCYLGLEVDWHTLSFINN